MPRLKPETRDARREAILDAAELCIARSGFHGATMAEICAEAGVSAGALYVHFQSKEALIAGITERDRNKLASEFATLGQAPDLFTALQALARHYTIDEPRHKRVLCIELGAEATRNPAVGDIYRSVDNFVIKSFETLFARAAAEGRIAPAHSAPVTALMVMLIGEGLFWRRAIDPSFEPETVMPAVMDVIGHLLKPIASDGADLAANLSDLAPPHPGTLESTE
ncbi:MAG: TetR/AcrR family transcriptional regulator [Hyphomicrobiaceae bacterium]|nr:TetR/AcrR family transcriptional regulator [Hyphomicrobiaceae bacterium]